MLLIGGNGKDEVDVVVGGDGFVGGEIEID